MLREPLSYLLAVLTAVSILFPAPAQEATFSRKADVIYGRKDGMALTFDVFTPAKANGAGIVLAVSGGYNSAAALINPLTARPLLDRGYTVFAVVHGSQPRYQVPDILQDMRRAVRFIRHHAKEYAIDPERLGAAGASSGGNLSVLLGVAGGPADANARDPVDRESSQVRAVACFFPPTDFLNFGRAGKEMLHATDHNPPFRAAFDYHELDPKTRVWERVTDPEKLREIARSISPIYQVSKGSAPTLILHGDADNLVPLQQSETYIEKLKAAGVPCELIVKKGAGHGWLDMPKDADRLVDWFDRQLPTKRTPAEVKPAAVGAGKHQARPRE